jgi:hypothetical protein
MPRLVHELQQAALDEKSSVSFLLRKALVVATKLSVSDFELWAGSELEGYQDGQLPLPEYRKVHGAPKVWNPYHGYQDLQCASAKLKRVSCATPGRRASSVRISPIANSKPPPSWRCRFESMLHTPSRTQ